MTNSDTSAVMPSSFLDLVPSGLAANLPAAANVLNAKNRFLFYYATDTGVLYVFNPVTGAWSGTASVGSAAQLVGAAKTAAPGGTYALDQASGSVLTLPGAVGSGAIIDVYVKTTVSSNADKILTNPTTDKLIGQLVGQTSNTPKQFSANVANGYHSIQMPFAGTQPSGGFEGDYFVFQDVSSGVWLVSGHYRAGTTPTTPFSTATT